MASFFIGPIKSFVLSFNCIYVIYKQSVLIQNMHAVIAIIKENINF